MVYLKAFQAIVLGNVLLVLILMAEGYGSQLSSRPADEWIDRLERPERIADLKRDQVLTHLGLKSGDVVADIGAGTGVFSRPLARAVAPSGRVLAVEIDQELLNYIEQRAQQENIENIEGIRGGFNDPNLPAQDVDLALIHDVLHHIEHREVYLKALTSYLTLEGRVAIIDFNKDHPDAPHRDDPALQITLEQVKQWMAAVGFEVVQEFTLFERKFFVVFSRGR